MTVMMCKLCTVHKPHNGSKRCWVDCGCRTIRRDRITDHEGSAQHVADVRASMATPMNFDVQLDAATEAAEDALIITRFIITHNLSLDLFEDLTALAKDLGATRLSNLFGGANATSAKSVQDYVRSLTAEVDRRVLAEVQESATYSIMADEVSDVASRKHLTVLCRHVRPDGSTGITERCRGGRHGTSATITAAIVAEIERSGLDITKISTLSADGASTFSGVKNGVAATLRRTNAPLIYYHCRDHRLALACNNSFSAIPLLTEVGGLLGATQTQPSLKSGCFC